jgi:8-oxo-dGTP pyrophosphatase MutT (NUDIX family)
MTDTSATATRQTEGNRVRAAGARAVKPRDAATLFIIRRDGPKPRVLMGKRHGGHDFMANLWVFPGGRIDKADFHAPYATDLRPEVAGKFHTHVTPAKARALGLAAIRETFEEAGLMLGKPVEPRPAVGPWRDFLAHGAAADLEALSIVDRAVTPPTLAKRYDTWFLMADAERLISLEPQPDCGELEEIAWFDFSEALDLKLPMVTRSVITEVMARLEQPERPIPYMRFRAGATKPREL